MKAQSEPEGQQMTDWMELVLRDMQDVSFGQQKEEGKLDPHCWRLSIPPHVGACRGRRKEAWAMDEAKRANKDILESLGSGAAGCILSERRGSKMKVDEVFWQRGQTSRPARKWKKGARDKAIKHMEAEEAKQSKRK